LPSKRPQRGSQWRSQGGISDWHAPRSGLGASLTRRWQEEPEMDKDELIRYLERKMKIRTLHHFELEQESLM